MGKRELAELLRQVTSDVNKNRKPSDDKLLTFDEYDHVTGGLKLIPTGHLAIDRILGGGIPCGRTIEIFGPFSSGKSVLCHEILARIYQLDGVVALQDTEASYSDDFGTRIGLPRHGILYTSPDTVAEASRQINALIDAVRRYDKKRFIGIGLDSVAALSTDHELENPDKSDMTKPRELSRMLRTLTRKIARTHVVFVVVNQVRQKIGVVFGNPETTPGGEALPFHTSVRIRVQRGALYKGHTVKLMDGTIPVGVRIVVDVIKNKIAAPFRRCEAIISFKDGLIPWSGYADLLADEALIDRDEKKKHFVYKGRSFKAHEIQEIIDTHPDLAKAISEGTT